MTLEEITHVQIDSVSELKYALKCQIVQEHVQTQSAAPDFELYFFCVATEINTRPNDSS